MVADLQIEAEEANGGVLLTVYESHRRNRPAHPQIAKVRNHNRHSSGGIANRASHRTTASPRPAAELHAQPPAHRTPDRSAAAG